MYYSFALAGHRGTLVPASVTAIDWLIDRRIRGDMIEVYKILTNKYDSGVNLYLEKQQDNITRGHSLKLVNITMI